VSVNRSESDILDRSEVLEQRMSLEYHPDALTERAETRLARDRAGSEREISHFNSSFTQWIERYDRAQNRRLPRS
jgi:hypothetical protein